jgi:hypothetical protein
LPPLPYPAVVVFDAALFAMVPMACRNSWSYHGEFLSQAQKEVIASDVI